MRLSLILLVGTVVAGDGAGSPTAWPEKIRMVLREAKPLTFSRGSRLPLYLWPAMNPGDLDGKNVIWKEKVTDEQYLGK